MYISIPAVFLFLEALVKVWQALACSAPAMILLFLPEFYDKEEVEVKKVRSGK